MPLSLIGHIVIYVTGRFLSEFIKYIHIMKVIVESWLRMPENSCCLNEYITLWSSGEEMYSREESWWGETGAESRRRGSGRVCEDWRMDTPRLPSHRSLARQGEEAGLQTSLIRFGFRCADWISLVVKRTPPVHPFPPLVAIVLFLSAEVNRCMASRRRWWLVVVTSFLG